MGYSLKWDLESIYAGGSDSKQLAAKIASIQADLKTLIERIKEWSVPTKFEDASSLKQLLEDIEALDKAISQARAFLGAASAENVHDTKASQLLGTMYSLIGQFETAFTSFLKKLVLIDEALWKDLLAQSELAPIAFFLNEEREKGKEQLSEAEEGLMNALSVDGFVGWSSHYDTLVNTIQIPYTTQEGEDVILSAGQAFNKMHDDVDPGVRATMFKKWEEAWQEKAPLFADTLNHLACFRLANYQAHGVEYFMDKPLKQNRMKQTTLDTMWKVIADNKKPFVEFLKQKATLFGKEQLSWEDVDAPIEIVESRHFTFDEGAAFIIDNFAKFGKKLPEFAKMAFERSWIEAENRTGKRPGGFCTGFPETDESRIFMTYSGSPNGVSTLAHELGHAFHSSVLKDVPYFHTGYAMNVAETASNFAEMIVADATVREAKTDEEKITLLDLKVQSAIAMFMNIHARYLFETRFYEERKSGIVPVERLNELMEDAQKEAFANSLSQYHPTFWASKLHFYKASVPFYNFPYTFGYLFSLGIYALSLKEGKEFEEKYIALLQDTAAMTTEELAMKHLGVDLTKPEFWQAGVDRAIEDVHEFLRLTKSL